LEQSSSLSQAGEWVKVQSGLLVPFGVQLSPELQKERRHEADHCSCPVNCEPETVTPQDADEYL